MGDTERIKASPNYIGMGMLSIPTSIREALYHWEETRRQAKQQYGFHRENMLIDADNQLVLAIEEYAEQLMDKAVADFILSKDFKNAGGEIIKVRPELLGIEERLSELELRGDQ